MPWENTGNLNTRKPLNIRPSQHPSRICCINGWQEPITRSLQLPRIPVTAFSQTDLFLVWIYHEFRSPQEPQRPIAITNTTNVDMSTWCRHVHVRPHCFIPIKACSFRLEMAYFARKISKNRLVCKNAVALAYYGSCRYLVMVVRQCIFLWHDGIKELCNGFSWYSMKYST